MNIRRRDPFTERDIKEIEGIHIPGIDVGRGWRTLNWMRKLPIECRAGGRTGRECRESCATRATISYWVDKSYYQLPIWVDTSRLLASYNYT